jgi:hypothetical protein
MKKDKIKQERSGKEKFLSIHTHHVIYFGMDDRNLMGLFGEPAIQSSKIQNQPFSGFCETGFF